NGTSIMLVTHDSALVQSICNRAAWLDHGEVRVVGNPREVVARYHEAYQRGQPALPTPTPRKTDRSSASPGGTGRATPISPVERKILEQEWFYSFDLPSGNRTPCYVSPEVRKFHTDRLAMMFSVLTPMIGQSWKETRCLDVGCNQGFFSVSLAE